MEHLTGVTELDLTSYCPQVSYVPGEEDFIPTNLSLVGFDFILDDYNIISVNTEFTKLLVPTPQPDNSEQDQGFISGIFGLLVMLQEGLAKN